MPYKDPTKRREMQKVYQERWRAKQPPEVKARRAVADLPAKARYRVSQRGVEARRAWRKSPAGRRAMKKAQYYPSSILARLRFRCRRSGTPCTLTVDDVARLIGPMRCAVTGLPLRWHAGGPHYELLSPSIDRIDNSGGYTPDNVQCVALWVNLARNGAPLAEFQGVLQQLYEMHAWREPRAAPA